MDKIGKIGAGVNFIDNLDVNRLKFYNLFNTENIAKFTSSIVKQENTFLFDFYFSKIEEKLNSLANEKNEILKSKNNSIISTWGAYVASVSKIGRRNILTIILLDIIEKDKIDLSMAVANRFFKHFLGKISSNEFINHFFSGLTYDVESGEIIKIARTLEDKITTKEFNDMFDNLMAKYSKRVRLILNAERDLFFFMKEGRREKLKELLSNYTFVDTLDD